MGDFELLISLSAVSISLFSLGVSIYVYNRTATIDRNVFYNKLLEKLSDFQRGVEISEQNLNFIIENFNYSSRKIRVKFKRYLNLIHDYNALEREVASSSGAGIFAVYFVKKDKKVAQEIIDEINQLVNEVISDIKKQNKKI